MSVTNAVPAATSPRIVLCLRRIPTSVAEPGGSSAASFLAKVTRR
jgi:hypothetical protein